MGMAGYAEFISPSLSSLGLLGGIFLFHSYFKIHFCKQTVENLVLHCLPMSHIKNLRLIWVNASYYKNSSRGSPFGITRIVIR